MEKLKVLIVTALLALSLIVVTPSVMADPTNPQQKDNGSLAVWACVALKTLEILPGVTFWEYYGFENFGQCMKWARHQS